MPGETPAAYVAAAGSGEVRAPRDSPARPAADVVVLGADTAVVVDGEILGKPRDDADAARMLRRLSGRAHEVMTGVSLRHGGIRASAGVETTAVEFAPLSDGRIAWYVASGEGRDKAGGYAIQGWRRGSSPRSTARTRTSSGCRSRRLHELLRVEHCIRLG